MTSQAFEQRVAAAVAAYADRAPVDVDAVAVTRFVATRSRRIGPVPTVKPVGRGLAVAFVLIALLVAIITGGVIVAGGRSPWAHPDDVLTRRNPVEPFVGLPPVGTAASTPETGELALAFYGRVDALGDDFHRMWVYEDGRLLWKRNLDVRTNLQMFGPAEPTTAIIEQRLSPAGVELLRSVALGAGLTDLGPADASVTTGSAPGVIWGGLRVRVPDADRLSGLPGGTFREVVWSSAALPRLLADPAAWLPVLAWDDPGIGGHVPSRYAICGEGFGADRDAATDLAAILDLLPAPARDVILSRSTTAGAGGLGDSRCPYTAATDDARAIAVALAEAGLAGNAPLRYSFPADLVPSGEFFVELLPILPSGEAVCNCG